MSISALRAAKAVTEGVDGSPLTRSEKLLLLCLADYVNNSSNVAYPSVRRLAGEVMVSERHIRNLLRSLEDKGLVSREFRVGTTSHYRLINLSPPVEPSDEPDTADVARPAIPEAIEDVYRDVENEFVGQGGVLDAFLDDAAWGRTADSATAYTMALQEAGRLADDLWPGQNQLALRLCSAVVARCAADLHGLGGDDADRLSREACLLGAGGHHHMISALLQTASAEPRDRVRYVVGAARRMVAADRASMHRSF